VPELARFGEVAPLTILPIECRFEKLSDDILSPCIAATMCAMSNHEREYAHEQLCESWKTANDLETASWPRPKVRNRKK